jgi:ferritin-like protein
LNPERNKDKHQMPQGSTTLHEDGLPAEVVDRHRAIVSLMEEMEAVDWYDQRAAATTNPELREILAHNRDEEKEHAMMVLEWLRRNDPKLREMIGTYIGHEGSIIHAEEEATGGGGGEAASGSSDGSLGIGSLRGGK